MTVQTNALGSEVEFGLTEKIFGSKICLKQSARDGREEGHVN